MRFLLVKVTSYRILVLIKVLCEYAVNCIIINDCALSWHYVVGEKKTGAKPVDVSHEYIFCLILSYPYVNTLAHAARRAIGKRQAQHIVRLHAVGESLTNALGKNLRLATSWGSEHEMLTMLDVKNFLLRLVGYPL